MAGLKISEHFAQRIKATIQRVEGIPVSVSGNSRPQRFEDNGGRSAPGAGVVEAFFTGGWPKNSNKQIRFLANTAATATAVNLLRSIPLGTSGATARNCTVSVRSIAVAAGEATHLLVNSEC